MGLSRIYEMRSNQVWNEVPLGVEIKMSKVSRSKVARRGMGKGIPSLDDWEVWGSIVSSPVESAAVTNGLLLGVCGSTHTCGSGWVWIGISQVGSVQEGSPWVRVYLVLPERKTSFHNSVWEKNYFCMFSNSFIIQPACQNNIPLVGKVGKGKCIYIAHFLLYLTLKALRYVM